MKLKINKKYKLLLKTVPYQCIEILENKEIKPAFFPAVIISNKDKEQFMFKDFEHTYKELEEWCTFHNKDIMHLIGGLGAKMGQEFVSWVERKNKDVYQEPVECKILNIENDGCYIVEINNKQFEILGGDYFNELFEVRE